MRAAADGAGAKKLRLFYNDYGIETPGAKADAVLRWITEQRAAGVPIDGIGFQAHLPCDCVGCNSTKVVAANMQRFVDAGFHVWVTELDVEMEDHCTLENQAAIYEALLGACLAIAPHCDSFMVWGFTDHIWSPTQWLAGKAPDIFDGDYHAKPAFFALQRLLNDTLAHQEMKTDDISATPVDDSGQASVNVSGQWFWDRRGGGKINESWCQAAPPLGPWFHRPSSLTHTEVIELYQSAGGAIIGRWVPSADGKSPAGGSITGEVVVDNTAGGAIPIVFNRFDTTGTCSCKHHDWTLWSVGRLFPNDGTTIHTSWVNNGGELATAVMTRMNESDRAAWFGADSASQFATDTAPVPMQAERGADFNVSWTVEGGDGQPLEAPFTSLQLWLTGKSGEAGTLTWSCTADRRSTGTASCTVLRGQYMNATGGGTPPRGYRNQIAHVDIAIADLETFAVVITLCPGQSRGAGQWIDTTGRAGKMNLCRASGCAHEQDVRDIATTPVIDNSRGKNVELLNATSHQLGSIWVFEEQVLATPAVKSDDVAGDDEEKQWGGVIGGDVQWGGWPWHGQMKRQQMASGASLDPPGPFLRPIDWVANLTARFSPSLVVLDINPPMVTGLASLYPAVQPQAVHDLVDLLVACRASQVRVLFMVSLNCATSDFTYNNTWHDEPPIDKRAGGGQWWPNCGAAFAEQAGLWFRGLVGGTENEARERTQGGDALIETIMAWVPQANNDLAGSETRVDVQDYVPDITKLGHALYSLPSSRSRLASPLVFGLPISVSSSISPSGLWSGGCGVEQTYRNLHTVCSSSSVPPRYIRSQGYKRLRSDGRCCSDGHPRFEHHSNRFRCSLCERDWAQGPGKDPGGYGAGASEGVLDIAARSDPRLVLQVVHCRRGCRVRTED